MPEGTGVCLSYGAVTGMGCCDRLSKPVDTGAITLLTAVGSFSMVACCKRC